MGYITHFFTVVFVIFTVFTGIVSVRIVLLAGSVFAGIVFGRIVLLSGIYKSDKYRINGWAIIS
ncbi:hypothetical protein BGX38DRAFT_1176421 [Terfezia claveryi]|nr:hypothetical protein BGX38DRAFT_1176421 [Terfezia claveryi]